MVVKMRLFNLKKGFHKNVGTLDLTVWREYVGIEPTSEILPPMLVLKTRRPTRTYLLPHQVIL
jgi:hypothetical protein